MVGLRFSLVAALSTLQTVEAVAQSGGGSKMTCNVVVTVTDPSGAVIQGAFVILRADRTGTRESFESENRTNAAGSVKTSLPCGLIDVLATADGFIPSAQKLLIGDETHAVSIPLRVYPRSDIQQVVPKKGR